MSWDILVVKFAADYASVDDVPADTKPLPLGGKTDVQDAVLSLFPTTDWSDPHWGRFDTTAGSIEFNLDTNDPPEHMMLHVRSGTGIVQAIVALCRKNNWSGVDTSTGDLIEKSANPEAGLSAWRSYLDTVLKKQVIESSR